jgi:WD40 repeat protein
MFVSASSDGTLKLWDIESGREIRTFSTGNPYSVFFDSVAFSPDGSKILSAANNHSPDNNMVILWDAGTGEIIRKYSLIPTGYEIESYEKTYKTEMEYEKVHSRSCRVVAFSPDGRSIFSGFSDGKVIMWDANTDEAIRIFSKYGDPVAFISFDGSRVICGYYGSPAVSWDADRGSEIKIWDATPVAISRDGFTADIYNGIITVRNINTNAVINEFPGRIRLVRAAAVSHDGSMIVSVSYDDETVIIWDIVKNEVRGFIGPKEMKTVAFSPDDSLILAGSDRGPVKLFNSASGEEVRTYAPERRGNANSVAFSPDGSQIICGFTSRVALFNTDSEREIRTFTGDQESIHCVAFNHDGSKIAAGSYDGKTRIWDTASGREIRTLTGQFMVNSVAFSPDGSMLASGAQNKTIKIWDAASGREIRTLTGHREGIKSLAFSPDGRRIVSGPLNDAIKIWDVSTGGEILSIPNNSGNIFSVGFIPAGGNRIFSSDEYGSTVIWDAVTGKKLAQLLCMQDGRWIVITE